MVNSILRHIHNKIHCIRGPCAQISWWVATHLELFLWIYRHFSNAFLGFWSELDKRRRERGKKNGVLLQILCCKVNLDIKFNSLPQNDLLFLFICKFFFSFRSVYLHFCNGALSLSRQIFTRCWFGSFICAATSTLQWNTFIIQCNTFPWMR